MRRNSNTLKSDANEQLEFAEAYRSILLDVTETFPDAAQAEGVAKKLETASEKCRLLRQRIQIADTVGQLIESQQQQMIFKAKTTKRFLKQHGLVERGENALKSTNLNITQPTGENDCGENCGVPVDLLNQKH